MSEITLLDAGLFSLGAGIASSVFFALLSIYLLASSFWQRAIWEDHATLRGKIRTTGKYVYRNGKWREMPQIAGKGFAIGFGAVFLSIVFIVGFIEIVT